MSRFQRISSLAIALIWVASLGTTRAEMKPQPPATSLPRDCLAHELAERLLAPPPAERKPLSLTRLQPEVASLQAFGLENAERKNFVIRNAFAKGAFLPGMEHPGLPKAIAAVLEPAEKQITGDNLSLQIQLLADRFGRMTNSEKTEFIRRYIGGATDFDHPGKALGLDRETEKLLFKPDRTLNDLRRVMDGKITGATSFSDPDKPYLITGSPLYLRFHYKGQGDVTSPLYRSRYGGFHHYYYKLDSMTEFRDEIWDFEKNQWHTFDMSQDTNQGRWIRLIDEIAFEAFPRYLRMLQSQAAIPRTTATNAQKTLPAPARRGLFFRRKETTSAAREQFTAFIRELSVRHSPQDGGLKAIEATWSQFTEEVDHLNQVFRSKLAESAQSGSDASLGELIQGVGERLLRINLMVKKLQTIELPFGLSFDQIAASGGSGAPMSQELAQAIAHTSQRRLVQLQALQDELMHLGADILNVQELRDRKIRAISSTSHAASSETRRQLERLAALTPVLITQENTVNLVLQTVRQSAILTEEVEKLAWATFVTDRAAR